MKKGKMISKQKHQKHWKSNDITLVATLDSGNSGHSENWKWLLLIAFVGICKQSKKHGQLCLFPFLVGLHSPRKSSIGILEVKF